MKKYQPTLEHAIYFIILIAALLLRFLHLGQTSLSEYESNWAYQAFQVARGLKPAIGPNPAYVHLTSILFFIFGASNFMARFWPALMGCILVLSPLFIRKQFGRFPSILLAMGLSIDPGLVAMSHLAGGSMLAVTFIVLAGLMWINRQYELAGVFGGIALLSGYTVWIGIFCLILTLIILQVFLKKKFPMGGNIFTHGYDKKGVVKSLTWGAGTLLVLGSLFVLSLKGLPAFALSLWDFFQGWWRPSNTPIFRQLLLIPSYEILPLVLGIMGIIRGVKNHDYDIVALSIWVGVAFIIGIFLPGKQPGEILWVLIPFWLLAAYELQNHFDFSGRNYWEIAGVVVFITGMLIFAWLNLAGLTTIDLTSSLGKARFLMLTIVIVLVGLSLLLIGTGWSVTLARLGGIWSFILVFGALTVALATGAGGLRQPVTAELWFPDARPGRLDTLQNVVDQISVLNKGVPEVLPITIVDIHSYSLLWLFRDYMVTQADYLAPDITPELIITLQSDISLTVKYRGEALPLSQNIQWNQAGSADWLRWFIYRQMPVTNENIILWVRNDLMLDAHGTDSNTY